MAVYPEFQGNKFYSYDERTETPEYLLYLGNKLAQASARVRKARRLPQTAFDENPRYKQELDSLLEDVWGCATILTGAAFKGFYCPEAGWEAAHSVRDEISAYAADKICAMKEAVNSGNAVIFADLFREVRQRMRTGLEPYMRFEIPEYTQTYNMIYSLLGGHSAQSEG